MIFTLTDRNYNPLDIYETDDYLIGKYTGSILETLDINIAVDDERSQFWQRGNYIMCRPSDGKNRWFTILDDEDGLNDDDKVLSCYSGTLDIISEEYPGISATQAQSFEWYFNAIFGDTGIVLGINELTGQERKLEYTSQNVTNAEMLQYVLNGFDNAEAELEVEFDGTVPQKIILNVYKRIGEIEPQVVLSDEDDSLTDLTRKGSISQLGTSLLCFGAEEEEQKVSLIGKEFVEKDADGNILYISYKESPRIYSIKGREDYYVQLPGKADGRDYGYINRTYSSEAKTQDALWTAGLAQLKKIDHAIVEYEAKGLIDCRIGDNVQIISHTMQPPVMISARVVEYKFNDDDPTRNEYKFSNYVELESNMGDLSAIIADIKKNIVYILSTTVDYQVSDQGATTPTGEWVTDLPETQSGQWLWTRTTQAMSNGTSVVSFGKSYNGVDGDDGISPEITVNPDTSLTIVDKNGTQTTPKLQGPKGDQGIMGVAYAQPTAPSTTQSGATWFKTKSASDNSVIGIYTLIGTTWTETPVTADALAVTSLSAISANLGTVTAGTINGVTINGSRFVNTFDTEIGSAGSGIYRKGETTVATGKMMIHYEQYVKSTKASQHIGYNTVSTDGYEMRTHDPSDQGTVYTSSQLNSSVLDMRDNTLGLGGTLTSHALTETGWQNLPLYSQFQTAEGLTPQFKIFYNTDGTREIRFRGQVTTRNAPLPGAYFTGNTEYFVGEMQVVKPTRNAFAQCPTGANVYAGARCVVLTDGRVQIITLANCNYVVLDTLRYTID